MITVKVRESSISVSGHAGMAPIGQDVVCAAVSALTLTLVDGLREVAKMDFCANEDSGRVRIRWKETNEAGRALIDTWYLGICAIARDYKDYVQIV